MKSAVTSAQASKIFGAVYSHWFRSYGAVRFSWWWRLVCLLGKAAYQYLCLPHARTTFHHKRHIKYNSQNDFHWRLYAYKYSKPRLTRIRFARRFYPV